MQREGGVEECRGWTSAQQEGSSAPYLRPGVSRRRIMASPKRKMCKNLGDLVDLGAGVKAKMWSSGDPRHVVSTSTTT